MTYFVLVVTGVALLIVSKRDRIQRLAEAIAKAEGYGVPGAIPTVRNNPGDIRGPDGNIATYPTPEAGWQALRHQIEVMLSGRSAYYNPEMSLIQVAQIYTGEPAYMNWANIVSSYLGVPPETRLVEV